MLTVGDIMVEREILTVDGAAELLGVSAYTIREMAKRGDIPARKVGKGWRFSREALVGMIRNPAAVRSDFKVPTVSRPLRITPAPRGSGRHDISLEHDKYSAGA